MLELEGRAREQLGQLALAEGLGIGIEPPRIGTERTVRLDRAKLGALEHVAIATLVAMTDRARVHVEPASALGRSRVDLMRAARGVQIAEPLLDPLDRSMVDRLRRHAGPERGGEIALVERRIVAVPVQLHAFARLLIEDRGKIAGTVALVGSDGAEQHVHLHELVGIEGVDPARSPRLLFGEEWLKARASLDEAFAHPRDDNESPNLPVDDTEVRAGRLHCRDQPIRLQALVDAGIENEADESVKIEVVRRHARDHDARRAFGGAVSPGVADGAIEPDEIDASKVALRNADGQGLLPAVCIRVVEKAKGPVVEAAVELRGKQSRQRLPDPEGDAAALVGTDRPVLEMGDDVGKDLGAVDREAHGRHEAEHDDDEADQGQQGEHDRHRQQQTSPPA